MPIITHEHTHEHECDIECNLEHECDHEHHEENTHTEQIDSREVQERFASLTPAEKHQLNLITSKYAAFCLFFVFANSCKDAFSLQEMLVYLDAEDVSNKTWVAITGLITSAMGSVALSASLIERTRRNFVLAIDNTHDHIHSIKNKLEDFFSLQLPISLIAAAGALSFYTRFLIGVEDSHELNTAQYISGIAWASAISGITVVGNSLFHLLFANEGRQNHDTLWRSFAHLMTTVNGQAPKTFTDYAILYIKISSIFSHVSEIYFELSAGIDESLKYLLNVNAPAAAVIPPSLVIACLAGVMHGNTEAMAFEEFAARTNLDIFGPTRDAAKFSFAKRIIIYSYLFCVGVAAFFHMLPDLIGFPELLTPKGTAQLQRFLTVAIGFVAYGISDWISSYVQFAYAANDLFDSTVVKKPLLTLANKVNIDDSFGIDEHASKKQNHVGFFGNSRLLLSSSSSEHVRTAGYFNHNPIDTSNRSMPGYRVRSRTF